MSTMEYTEVAIDEVTEVEYYYEVNDKPLPTQTECEANISEFVKNNYEG